MAIGVVIFFATGGSNGPIGGIIHTGPPQKTPAFAFTVEKPLPVPTLAGAKAKKYAGVAKTASNAATQVMDALYTEAFLDPANWQSGTYDKVWVEFDTGAAAQARKHVSVLTAGTSAGDIFGSIEPSGGALKPHVLIDSKGQPISIVAIVHFSARAKEKNGETILMQSNGEYFLRQVSGSWKVVSFQVNRSNRKVKPSPTPQTSGAATPIGTES